MGYHPEDQINNDYWVIGQQGFSMLILYVRRGSFVTISGRVALSRGAILGAIWAVQVSRP